MIYAKTRMRKMPKTCKQCSVSIVEHEWGGSHRICGITQNDCPMEQKKNGSYGYTREKWCPLVEVKE